MKYRSWHCIIPDDRPLEDRCDRCGKESNPYNLLAYLPKERVCEKCLNKATSVITDDRPDVPEGYIYCKYCDTWYSDKRYEFCPTCDLVDELTQIIYEEGNTI